MQVLSCGRLTLTNKNKSEFFTASSIVISNEVQTNDISYRIHYVTEVKLKMTLKLKWS